MVTSQNRDPAAWAIFHLDVMDAASIEVDDEENIHGSILEKIELAEN